MFRSSSSAFSSAASEIGSSFVLCRSTTTKSGFASRAASINFSTDLKNLTVLPTASAVARILDAKNMSSTTDRTMATAIPPLTDEQKLEFGQHSNNHPAD